MNAGTMAPIARMIENPPKNLTKSLYDAEGSVVMERWIATLAQVSKKNPATNAIAMTAFCNAVNSIWFLYSSENSFFGGSANLTRCGVTRWCSIGFKGSQWKIRVSLTRSNRTVRGLLSSSETTWAPTYVSRAGTGRDLCAMMPFEWLLQFDKAKVSPFAVCKLREWMIPRDVLPTKRKLRIGTPIGMTAITATMSAQAARTTNKTQSIYLCLPVQITSKETKKRANI